MVSLTGPIHQDIAQIIIFMYIYLYFFICLTKLSCDAIFFFVRVMFNVKPNKRHLE